MYLGDLLGATPAGNPYPGGIAVAGSGSSKPWPVAFYPALGIWVANTGFAVAPIYRPDQFRSIMDPVTGFKMPGQTSSFQGTQTDSEAGPGPNTPLGPYGIVVHGQGVLGTPQTIDIEPGDSLAIGLPNQGWQRVDYRFDGVYWVPAAVQGGNTRGGASLFDRLIQIGAIIGATIATAGTIASQAGFLPQGITVTAGPGATAVGGSGFTSAAASAGASAVASAAPAAAAVPSAPAAAAAPTAAAAPAGAGAASGAGGFVSSAVTAIKTAGTVASAVGSVQKLIGPPTPRPMVTPAPAAAPAAGGGGYGGPAITAGGAGPAIVPAGTYLVGPDGTIVQASTAGAVPPGYTVQAPGAAMATAGTPAWAAGAAQQPQPTYGAPTAAPGAPGVPGALPSWAIPAAIGAGVLVLVVVLTR
jgi:hypothetical protein